MMSLLYSVVVVVVVLSSQIPTPILLNAIVILCPFVTICDIVVNRLINEQATVGTSGIYRRTDYHRRRMGPGYVWLKHI